MNIGVAIIEPVGGHGGMDYYDFGLAQGLVDAGCSVTIYTCNKTSIPKDSIFNCRLSFNNIYGNRNKVVRGFNFLRGLLTSLIDARSCKAQIVHFHFFHAGGLELLSCLLAKAFCFKVVTTVHDVESFSGSGGTASAKRIFSLADHIVAHNKVSASELIDKVGIPAAMIERIPHGNYLLQANSAPSRENARLALSIDSTRKVILFFGQIKKVKGLDLLLEAFSRIQKEHPDSLLVIAGKVWKDDFSIYQELINRHEMADSVRLDIRYISDSDALLYYSAADTVVLPYRKIYQSGVLLMAMSLNRLVVVSDLKGMTEIVDDGLNGLVFRANDIDSLAKTLSQALSSPDRDKMAERGHQLMLSHYSWADIGVRTKSLYERVIRPSS